MDALYWAELKRTGELADTPFLFLGPLEGSVAGDRGPANSGPKAHLKIATWNDRFCGGFVTPSHYGAGRSLCRSSMQSCKGDYKVKATITTPNSAPVRSYHMLKPPIAPREDRRSKQASTQTIGFEVSIALGISPHKLQMTNAPALGCLRHKVVAVTV